MVGRTPSQKQGEGEWHRRFMDGKPVKGIMLKISIKIFNKKLANENAFTTSNLTNNLTQHYRGFTFKIL